MIDQSDSNLATGAAPACSSGERRPNLIVLGAIVLGLGLLVALAWPPVRGYLFARELRAIGCDYRTYQTSTSSPYSTARLTEIVLRGPRIDDAWVGLHQVQLSRIRSLRLEIDATQCGCESLQIIGAMRNVESLTLNGERFNNDCVTHLLVFRTLWLKETRLTEAGVASLIARRKAHHNLTVPAEIFGPAVIAATNNALEGGGSLALTLTNATEETVGRAAKFLKPPRSESSRLILILEGSGVSDDSIPQLLSIGQRFDLVLRGHGLSPEGIDRVIQAQRVIQNATHITFEPAWRP